MIKAKTNRRAQQPARTGSTRSSPLKMSSRTCSSRTPQRKMVRPNMVTHLQSKIQRGGILTSTVSARATETGIRQAKERASVHEKARSRCRRPCHLELATGTPTARVVPSPFHLRGKMRLQLVARIRKAVKECRSAETRQAPPKTMEQGNRIQE